MSQIPPTVEHIDWAGLTFVGLQNLTEPTAHYLEKPDPQAVLRRSLVNEAEELVFELDNSDSEARKERITGEVGDVLWHCVEIPRVFGFQGLDLAGGASLNLYQKYLAPGIEPKIGYDIPALGKPEQFTTRDKLVISVLRCVDIMNPKDTGLWPQMEAKGLQSIADGVSEMLRNLAIISSEEGVSMSNAAEHMVKKLATRTRKPHVLDEPEVIIDSLRERIAVHPLIWGMLTKQFLAEN
jgi:NTP pyrophosphatase (non-canonical NTP hydrolase)